jgi:putrescine transport system substrate-binding protein
MRRLTLLCSLFAVSTLAIAQPKPALTVATWSDYINPELLVEFERQHNAEVKYVTYANAEGAETLLRGNQQVDVMVAPYQRIPSYLQDHLLAPTGMNAKQLKPLQDIKVMAKLSSKDSQMVHSTPYLWGRVGLAINRQKVEAILSHEAPSSWSMLFEPENAKKLSACGISMLDARDEVLAIYLNYRGYTVDGIGGYAAKATLKQLADARRYYRYVDNVQYAKDLREGKLCVSMAWVGDAIAAQKAGQPIEFLVPNEGSIEFMNAMIIPQKSQQQPLARAFVKFMNRDDVMERNARHLHYLSPSKKARKSMMSETQYAPLNLEGRGVPVSYAMAKEAVEPLLKAQWELLRQSPR